MVKVYILFEAYEYEDSKILAVYADKVKADQRARELNDTEDYSLTRCSYFVREYAVQEE